jgi:hypothetical protein
VRVHLDAVAGRQLADAAVPVFAGQRGVPVHVGRQNVHTISDRVIECEQARAVARADVQRRYFHFRYSW